MCAAFLSDVVRDHPVGTMRVPRYACKTGSYTHAACALASLQALSWRLVTMHKADVWFNWAVNYTVHDAPAELPAAMVEEVGVGGMPLANW